MGEIKFVWKHIVLSLLGPACFVLCGCGEPGTPTIQVKGLITIDGKAPPTSGKIYFAPIEAAEGLPKRAASGEFDAEGKFILTTFKPGDGVIPGKYRVNVDCWREPPTLKTKWSANYIPPDFNQEIEIKVDAEEPFEIKIEAPIQK